ncbi:MAG: Holo-[acyl-carrier-protein] synthase [candidate division TM6 bacterium GW2011_GWF2_32_72]|nr:MAG: Holo-[acyl-carrier-protein] synthase [candidate division TM6 bacterium GW2011_GWF2_32_72]
MILGIGLDTVEIARFKDWHKKSMPQLLKIFTKEEVEYCVSEPTKSSERFAARFAAKEAAFKAICQAFGIPEQPFLSLCRNIEVIKDINGLPKINLKPLVKSPINSHITITHTRTSASVIVILEAKTN